MIIRTWTVGLREAVRPTARSRRRASAALSPCAVDPSHTSTSSAAGHARWPAGSGSGRAARPTGCRFVPYPRPLDLIPHRQGDNNALASAPPVGDDPAALRPAFRVRFFGDSWSLPRQEDP